MSPSTLLPVFFSPSYIRSPPLLVCRLKRPLQGLGPTEIHFLNCNFPHVLVLYSHLFSRTLGGRRFLITLLFSSLFKREGLFSNKSPPFPYNLTPSKCFFFSFLGFGLVFFCPPPPPTAPANTDPCFLPLQIVVVPLFRAPYREIFSNLLTLPFFVFSPGAKSFPSTCIVPKFPSPVRVPSLATFCVANYKTFQRDSSVRLLTAPQKPIITLSLIPFIRVLFFVLFFFHLRG